jgi:hypothetical protein
MSIVTVLAYYVGSRKAILRIAATPGASWLGLVFVFSAGFAREYDGEDLLAQPWHLLLPLAASLVLSFALYCLLMPLVRWKGARQGTFWGNYWVFLRLFWMTAPIAWIYAIPVQEFLSAGDATRANLWMLAIVSLWRVVLMARVVSVTYNAHPVSAAMPVLLFANTVALVALWLAPLPVFSIMGGIRLTESETVIQGTAFVVGFFGTILWPMWLIGLGVAFGVGKRTWKVAVPASELSNRVSRGLWALAAGSIFLWVFVLPFTQPKQQLRNRIEVSLRGGRIPTAIALMSEHEPTDFPRHWDPPPRIGYGETTPPLLDVLEVLCQGDPPGWVKTMYVDKLASQSGGHGPFSIWMSVTGDELDRYLTVLEALPETHEMVRNDPHQFEQILRQPNCTPAQSERVRAILAAVGHEVKAPQEHDGGASE